MQVMPDRLTVARLMAVVAALAVLLGAWLYRRDHADVEMAMITADLQALNQADDLARRVAAAHGLGGATRGDPARIAAALVLAVLGDPAPEVRRAAAGSLAPSLARWAHANPAAPGTGVRVNLPPSFGATDGEATAVRASLRTLNDPRPEVRRAAAEAFKRIEESVQLTAELDAETEPAVDRLLARSDPDPTTRSAAIWCLARMVKPTLSGRNRVKAIAQADPSPYVRSVAVAALLRGWTPQVDLYPILLAACTPEADPTGAAPEVYELLKLPPPPPEAVLTLVRLLATGGDRGAVAAAVLGKLGPAGRPYLGSIRELADRAIQAGDRDWLVCHAVGALVAIDPHSAEAQALLGPLFGRLRAGPSLYDLDQLERAIASYHAAAAPLVPELRVMLAGPDPHRRDQAARLLASIGAPAVAAIPDLEAVQGQRQSRSRAVANALAHLQMLQGP